jgi:membrane protein DedA with SNARE-associated domain
MPPDALTNLILEYRYWILIPLSFIEGPIIAFVAGALAALNYFNIYALAILFFVRDVGMDIVYYAIGYFWGKFPSVHSFLRNIGVTDDHIEDVKALWLRRPALTLFLGKLAYGISVAFIVASGILKMPFRLVLLYGSIVAVLQYGSLLLIGYFLGVSFGGTVEKILINMQYVLGAAMLALVAYFAFTWRMRRKFFKEEVDPLQTDSLPKI